MTAPTPELAEHEMSCMEIWSGHRAVENKATSRGLEAWIYSNPYQGDAEGGDVHYFSLCVGGIVTRLVLADVAGHGSKVASVSSILKNLMRRHMNSKGQKWLVAEINREFSHAENDGRFATAVVMTYLSQKKQLLLSNAGHPRPIFYSQTKNQWTVLELARTDSEQSQPETAENLPFGIDESAKYSEHAIPISEGDILLLYTDALTEAINQQDQQFGESGLLAAVESIGAGLPCDQFGRQLLSAVRSFSASPAGDDETVIVVRFGQGKKSPGLLEKLQGYAALLTGT